VGTGAGDGRRRAAADGSTARLREPRAESPRRKRERLNECGGREGRGWVRVWGMGGRVGFYSGRGQRVWWAGPTPKEPLGEELTGRYRADRWSGPCPCRAAGLGCGPSTARSLGPGRAWAGQKNGPRAGPTGSGYRANYGPVWDRL